MLKTIQIIVLATLCLNLIAKAQSQNTPPLLKKQAILGKVSSATTAEALPNAAIKITTTNQTLISNDKGEFILTLDNGSYNLSVSYLGYKTNNISIQIPLKEPLIISLQPEDNNLKEVEIVSTGYQTLEREKTTGSFVQIDNKLLNRSTSTNVLERIKDVAPGIYFESRDPQQTIIARGPGLKSSGIVIRGQSTFNGSTEPLIILDNFPYEGEIKNINPNDVETITILKDASAASIWGAKSGNGVIVITTKKGKLKQTMSVDFNSTVSLTAKPDLFYSPNTLSAKNYIEVEQFLYDKGYFKNQLNNTTSFPIVSPSVELMRKFSLANNEEDRNLIKRQLDSLKTKDVRNDYEKYVYQTSVNQQYSLGLRGGTNNMSYSLSVGLDENKNNLIRNGYNRSTINYLNTFRPLPNLELIGGINYSRNVTFLNNSFGYPTYSLGAPYSVIFPYASLAEKDGTPASLLQNLRQSYIDKTQLMGFLDWNYRPLEEISLADNDSRITNLLLKVGAKYQIEPGWSILVNYQNEHQLIIERNYHTQESYYARDLINKFSAYDAETGVINYIFPKGGILDLGNTDWQQNNLRAQMSYEKNFNKHAFGAIAGIEFKELKTQYYSRTSYGYNDQFGTSTDNLSYNTFYPINPSGSDLLPAPSGAVYGELTRSLSYFTSSNYNYAGRYTFNVSARIDGANLFGAKINDKLKPFISTGIGWHINNEKFYDVTWMPSLRLRASYGFQGNTYQRGSAYLSGIYIPDPITGAPSITIGTAANPRLQWETVKTINTGVDFASKNDVVSGSIELYKKNGQNLIQPVPLALQTGFDTYEANTASTITKGIDMTIHTKNLDRALKWQTTFLYSGVKDKVVKYDVPLNSSSILGRIYKKGASLNGVYSYKWAGLNPVNGNPRGYLNGALSENYLAIINNFNPDSLVYNGSRTPTSFGSIRNDFSFKNFSFSFNISYSLGYVFRRSSTSTNYNELLGIGQHTDYSSRWLKPGDENTTNVPSAVYPGNSRRNRFYQYAEVLVENADHVRLQDIRFAFDMPQPLLKRIKAKSISLFIYASNLGIIWRENKLGLDPSSVGNLQGSYPLPTSVSFGLTAKL